MGDGDVIHVEEGPCSHCGELSDLTYRDDVITGSPLAVNAAMDEADRTIAARS